MLRSPAIRASIGLVLGLLTGIAISLTGSGVGRAIVGALEPIGTLWVNGIRMTVIPLVVSLLIATIARQPELGAVGRLGRRAIAVFVVLLCGVALLGFLAGPPLFSVLRIDGASAASVRLSIAANSGAPPVQLPSFGSWVAGLVPANPVKAAADGAMLPLIVFAVLFGVALARTAPELRTAGTAFFGAVADAMLVIVAWVLAFAPIGAFALAASLGAHVGLAVAGAVGLYLLVHCGLLTVAGALLYVVVRTAGAVPLRRFARAVLPAQVIAVSTRSSVAALPAMLESAERVLHLPPSVTGFVLPFGVAVFRINQGITWVVSALFIGKLYGVHLAWSQLALFAATSVAMSFSVPGIPSAALFMIAPFFPMVGLPVEGVGILIGLDVIPDLFKTSLNVTGHMAATVLLAREQETPGVAAPALPVEARLPAYR